MIPGVTETLSNGNIGGAPNTFDSIVGQIITGVGEGGIGLLQPLKFVSLADAETQGLTASAEPEAHAFVKQFYADAPLGSILFLMLVANTASIQTLCDVTADSGAKLLVDFASGNAYQIRVLGVSRTPGMGYEPATDEFIDSDAHLAGANAQAFVAAYFALKKPLRILIGARVADPASSTVFAPNTAGHNGVGYTIGGSTADGYGSVGMGTILAKVAATAPQVNIGRVKDGALSIASWYIGAWPIKPPANGTDPWYQTINSLIDVGYITATFYEGKAGYFLSDDPMATTITDDYQSLANCRVIDKASILAYQAFLTYVNDDVDLIAGGKMDPADITDIQQQIVNKMAAGLAGNISGTPSCYINPDQVFSAGAPFTAKVRVTPKGYLKQIEIDLGFTF